jgi:uncharacterized protein YbjT (DUF2867 family)
MHIAVLAASGGTGHQLALQALERGHTVTAIARRPAGLELPVSEHLFLAGGDVRDKASIARAVDAADVVVSGLGVVRGEPSGTLLAGATALVEAGPPRIIWLGAFGTGPSAAHASAFARGLIGVALRAQMSDKIAADSAMLAAGATVFHAGPLTNGPLSTTYRVVELSEVPRRLFAASISRATVASAMLDSAEDPSRVAGVVVPLSD